MSGRTNVIVYYDNEVRDTENEVVFIKEHSVIEF